jgi:hypothetical protein
VSNSRIAALRVPESKPECGQVVAFMDLTESGLQLTREADTQACSRDGLRFDALLEPSEAHLSPTYCAIKIGSR